MKVLIRALIYRAGKRRIARRSMCDAVEHWHERDFVKENGEGVEFCSAVF